MAFTHLHVHSEYSLLDGAARINDLIDQAKKLGMEAIALTDHGVMFGAVDFYKKAKSADIKPILGCEVYTATRGMEDKDAVKDKNQGHLVLLAENLRGYKNLMKIVSASFIRGFYYKPRVDKDLLRQYSDGIIALSGCLVGDIQQKLVNRDYAGAKKEALELRDIFGSDNFFLEIQNQELEDEDLIYDDLVKMSRETGIPLVATNDVHYVNKENAASHDILLCIQTAKFKDDEDRMRFPNDEFYLKSEKEMRFLFPELDEAIDNTNLIADRCNVELEFGNLHLPEFHSPEGRSNKDYLRELCENGLKERYGENSEEHRERLEYELDVIEQMGYIEYFLIVWDFIRYARENDIEVGPGRGSAAGSIVAYTLKITGIDPIKYGLIFERFLNPERISMPDIDIDFCYERRGEVIDYVIDKYGEDHVAQIITFGTLKAKAVVRDVGRTLGMPYGDVDKIAKMIPFSLDMTIDKALKSNPELKAAYDSDKRIKALLDTSKELEGMPRHAGTHAAGVVISEKSLDEYVPLYNSDKGVSTQFPMGTIEELGLLKMDFLGLRTLTVIRDALDMIKQEHGISIDFSSMEYDDSNIYELISGGNTQGIFQLESAGMTDFMKRLKPDCFEDVIAGISLYRPGPMSSIPKYISNKKNESDIEYLHESLEPILSVTYGCLVYQEQVMEIVRKLAGYSYGRSDLVRRAMSKKKRDVMLKEEEAFVAGCSENKISINAAKAIYNQMVSFAEYAFNKSHAAAYAVVAYQTAYLKAHYPVEFMAALMTGSIGESSKIARYVRNCNDMGIEVLPPCVGKSQRSFTVEDGKIRFGLLGIKDVGEGTIEAIIESRQENELHNIFEFIKNLDITQINKKALEGLIKAGALDCFDANRAKHMSVYERVLEKAQNDAKKTANGQTSLFSTNKEEMKEAGMSDKLPDIADHSKQQRMIWEREYLGIYLTDHPLSDSRDIIDKVANITTEEISHADENPHVEDDMQVLVVAVINHKKTQLTKNNKMMAFLEVEDMFGSIEVIVFPNTYEKASESINEDEIVVVRGRLNFKEEEQPKIIAEKVTPISIVREFYKGKEYKEASQ